MMNLTKKQYTHSDKMVISACVLAVLVIVYGITHFKTAQVNLNKNESHQINYEMAKLQTSESLYSLENREIEIDYKALEAKIALKAEQAKKLIADKTKKAVTAPAVAALATPAQQAAAQRNKAQAIKRIQAAAMTETPAEEKAQNEKAQPAVNAAASAPIQNNEPVPVDNPVNKKSYEQWRSEIFAAQNKEIIMKLVTAYKKGEISNEDFQRLATEMLASKDDKIVGLGLYALRSAPSYASYVQLINMQAAVNSSYATYIQESLMSYHQNSGLAVLKQGLASQDKAVLMKTLEIIKTGVTSIKAGTVTILVDSRYRRNTEAGQFSLTNYLSFLPLLQNLVDHSSDQEIVNLASQSITIIDDPQHIAAN